MNIKAAIFDMDGTLVDSLMLWDIIWKAYGDKFLNGEKFIPDKKIDKAIRTLPLKNGMELLFDRYGFGGSAEELLAYTTDIFADAYRNIIRPKEGVIEFLEKLYADGVKMCIASATAPDLVNIALDACDLRKYFIKFFSCADLGLGKDKPDIYYLALDFLKTEKAETFVFEDSLVAVDTAMKAGFPTVGIYDKYNDGAEQLETMATYFIADGETLCKLIEVS